MKRTGLLLAAVSLAALALGGEARAAAPPVPACNGGSCAPWFRADVSVSWSIEPGGVVNNCSTVPVTSDGSHVRSCSVSYPLPGGGTQTFDVPVTVKRDATPPSVTVGPSRGPDGNGWYRQPVSATASGTDATSGIASCSGSTYGGPDTGGAVLTATCTDAAGNSAGGSTTIKYDATAPSVSASPARPPDGNGWYNKPLAVTATGSDGASGVAACGTATYSGPDSAAATVTASCSDAAGNTGSASFALKYDATAPAATAAPSRPPDRGGWYVKPLSVRFAGTDGGSGVAGCDAPVEFKGPDGDPRTVQGACRDAAGNVGAAKLDLRYDATPPKPPGVTGEAGDRVVTLGLDVDASTADVRVLRSVAGRKGSVVVFRGKRAKIVDRKVRNGVRYRYVVVATDAAGNEAQRALDVMPHTPVYLPAGTTVRGAPLLAWRPVKTAVFYNVQLRRGAEKLLSTWPTTEKLRLPKRWSYLGRNFALAPGRYTVHVWPAYGSRASPRYGPLVGRLSFVVRA